MGFSIEHLIQIPGRVRALGLRCTCGEYASRFMRCPRCRGVISRCGSCGSSIARDREACCR